MSEFADEFEQFDASIDDVLAGRASRETDPGLLWLAATSRTTPPASLVARIDAAMTPPPAQFAAKVRARDRRLRDDRPSLVLSGVAVALAMAFLTQALGSLTSGEWIADGLGEPYSPHPYFEGALAMSAAAVCALAAAVRRSWAGLSVLTCTPLALSLGVHGFGEIGQFAAGVALHLTEGALGLALIAAWWWDRRDTRRRSSEDQT